ncbi:hypothetical protein HNR46_003988 [Haloferula luteola]|uniref:Uncharacterized protein n=1 Tax=Haloferula luteola TaxID=595692 RepID=A0A840V642_9BACT|nr:hypothetical protein [Haloferula luteola]
MALELDTNPDPAGQAGSEELPVFRKSGSRFESRADLNAAGQLPDPRPRSEDYLVGGITRLPVDATPEQAAALTPSRIAAERRAAAGSSEAA